jgi:endonuclease/exonuclease/phosphatase family metal-dependent hydrolase
MCALILLGVTAAATAEVRIASWNIRHLGWNNGKDFDAVALVALQFDIIAIQELMEPAALTRLRDRLEGVTGVAWRQLTSQPQGRGRYQEHYGFLWRSDRVRYEQGAATFLDPGDAFAREPISARFRRLDSGAPFVLATVHIRHGDGRSDRIPEIQALTRYWRWLAETHADVDLRLLAGDFNLEPGDPAWRALDAHARALLTRGGSTLSTLEGRYASLYDNIFVPDDYRLGNATWGVFRYPEAFNWSHLGARDRVSDHAPVYLVLGADRLTLRQPESPPPADDDAGVVIACAHPDAQGADAANLADEYVELHNLGGEAVELRGWALRDAAGHRLALRGRIAAGARMRVSSEAAGQPIWNNGGDSVTLLRDDATVAFEGRYPGSIPVCDD